MEHSLLEFDKRKYPRIQTHLPVKHWLINQSDEELVLLAHERENWDGKTKNLSPDGLCLTTERELNQGDILKIEVNLPGERKSLRAFSEVKWSSEQGPGNYIAGIFFTALREEDAEKIRRFVDQSLRGDGNTLH